MRTGRLVGRQEGKINTKEKGSRRRNSGDRQGKLRIVGIGPGDLSHLTQKARDSIVESQVIVGYNTYVKLLGKLTAGKEVIATGMTREKERAKQAIIRALSGKRVCLISSGDPGVYGMAAVALEVLGKRNVKVEIIPGVIAATACAGLLGAPLANDFACVSLSDILVDWRDIAARLKAVLEADFVVVLYNPKSRTRTEPLRKAWEIIGRYRSSDTPVGIVRNAFRDGQAVWLIRLKEAPAFKNVDMKTTIIVGNSKTFIGGGRMITPRGYKDEIDTYRDKP